MRMLAGLLVGIWVARYLGPAQFGLFSYAVAFAALFSSIAKLGLDSIMVRDLVREPAQRDIYMGTAFWLKLAGSLAMLGVIGIALQLTEYTTNWTSNKSSDVSRNVGGYVVNHPSWIVTSNGIELVKSWSATDLVKATWVF